ncbi:MAG TPA: AI-2E family transporter [Pyrinomonadaceae bacterium]
MSGSESVVADKEDVEVAAETAAVAAAEASWMQPRFILRAGLVLIAAWYAAKAALWALYLLEGVILLVVLAIFFAYLIAPLVEFVRRPLNVRRREHIIPRPLAIGIVYLVIFGTVGVLIYLLLPKLSTQMTEFGQQAPGYLTSARARAESLNRLYDNLQLPATVRKTVNDNITHLINAIGGYTTEGIGNILLESVHYVPWLVLIPILAFFLLKDVDSFRRSALQMLPSGRWRWRGDEFFQDVNSTLAAYIRAQLIACLLIGTICTIGFWAIGLPYPLLLGIIAALLEFIPLVGPLTVAIIAVLIASFYSVNQAIIVFLFLGILRIVHDYVTYPRIIGQGIHLHPLAVILAILSGAELAGVAGIFLAIPVVAIISVSYRHWLEHRGSEGLVADLLKPAEKAMQPSTAAPQAPTAVSPLAATVESSGFIPIQARPSLTTTPEEMARARPDLTSGELKMPNLE